MRLMALHTGGNISVLIVMAHRALYQCMFARILLKLLSYFTVAIITHLSKFSACCYLFFRCMRFSMTVGASGNFFTMEETVAVLTLGHDFIPVLLIRVVSMVFGMTFHTIKLMLAPICF